MVTRRRSAQPYQMRNVGGLLEKLSDEPSTDISITKIRLPKEQPRKYFDSAKMHALVESVREYGILEPLLVRPLTDGEYELVAGERRLRAAKEVGLDVVPIVSRELDDQDSIRIALIENLQREDLNPVEETEAILNLLSIELSLEKEGIATVLNQAANAKKRDQELTGNVSRQVEQIGKVLASVADITPETFRTTRLPLLNLPVDVLDALRQGQIEYTKAKAIARVKDNEQRHALLQQVINEGLSLAQIRAEIAVYQSSENKQVATLRSDFDRVYGKLKKSDVWNDSKKQTRLKKLLAGIESLLEEN